MLVSFQITRRFLLLSVLDPFSKIARPLSLRKNRDKIIFAIPKVRYNCKWVGN